MDARGSVMTPWGRLALEFSAAGLRRVEFDGPAAPALTGIWATAFDAYLHGKDFPETLPLDLAGVPPFTQRVLAACRSIPFGVICTYHELAVRVGCPRGARAAC